MNLIGKTIDGKIIVNGLFKLYDTSGLPFEVIFDLCKKDDFMPSWMDLYNEARVSGWSHKTIINRLSESLFEVYGKDFRDVVVGRLNEIYRT